MDLTTCTPKRAVPLPVPPTDIKPGDLITLPKDHFRVEVTSVAVTPGKPVEIVFKCSQGGLDVHRRVWIPRSKEVLREVEEGGDVQLRGVSYRVARITDEDVHLEPLP